MNKLLTLIVASILSGALLLSGCGSSGSTAKEVSLVTVNIGGNGKLVSLSVRPATLVARAEVMFKKALRAGIAFAAGIPSTVQSVRITVSASDITSIIRTHQVLAGSQEVTDTFEVPNGTDRKFTVEALNIGGNTIYTAPTETVSLNGEAISLSFNMEAAAPLGSVIVYGTVTADSATGDPLAGATVTFGSNPPVTTGPIGMYVADLAPGSYTVTASLAGYTPYSGTVQIAPSADGGFVTVNIVMTRAVAF